MATVGTITLRATTARLRRTFDVCMRLETALDGLLLPHLRRRINEALHVPFDTLEVREANGLAETVDPSLEVTTSARAQLTALMGPHGVWGDRHPGRAAPASRR